MFRVYSYYTVKKVTAQNRDGEYKNFVYGVLIWEKNFVDGIPLAVQVGSQEAAYPLPHWLVCTKERKMSDWNPIPKLEGKVLQIQVEQLGQQAALVFAIQTEKGEKPLYFANPFHGDPIVCAQLALLRDALINNKRVRIAYEVSEENQAARMLAIRIHTD